MFERILVAFDGSEAACSAFESGLDIAAKYGARLRVIAVARPPEFGDEVETEAVIENSRRHYQRVLKPLKERTAKAGIDVEFELAVGQPAERIVAEAERWDARLVIMGTAGTGSWAAG